MFINCFEVKNVSFYDNSKLIYGKVIKVDFAACPFAYTHTHTHTHIHTYIDTHTHTHIHTYIHT